MRGSRGSRRIRVGVGRRAGRVLALALLTAGACAAPRDRAVGPRPRGPSPLVVRFFASEGSAGARLLQGARLAAAELSNERLLGRPVRVEVSGSPDGVSLAAVVDDPDVIGVLTAAGADAIVAAGDALDEWRLAVFELSDDLYEAGRLRPSVFQMSPPHSWEAWRLARYFGPGDRGYRKVGLLRSGDLAGRTASDGLRPATVERGLAFVESVVGPAGVEAALAGLRSEAPEAVVIEGPPSLLREAAALLGAEPSRYLGRARIRDGWRPQIAGFDSLMRVGVALAPGTVAANDYARATERAETIEAVRRFREAFRRKFGTDPSGEEARGYDAVHLLGEAVKRAGSTDRAAILGALEAFDRVRFGRLPVSFGPNDHVAAERDALGVWAVVEARGGDPWLQIMRTFTADLERTNILEHDWPAFFEGTTPGGEAPFYHGARRGIVTDKTDDLH